MTSNLSAATVERIGPGTLLVAPDTSIPASWQIDSDPVVRGWSRVEHELTELEFDSDIASRGWTFFFRPGPVRTTSWGWSEIGNVSKAIAHLASAARRLKCNCLQIDSITAGTWLGIPRMRMVAHVRHIQTGTVFSGT